MDVYEDMDHSKTNFITCFGSYRVYGFTLTVDSSADDGEIGVRISVDILIIELSPFLVDVYKCLQQNNRVAWQNNTGSSVGDRSVNYKVDKPTYSLALGASFIVKFSTPKVRRYTKYMTTPT
uniref:Uncharacterized protein n=1 Tax=Timema monikensis TaxID=170555 RepID=A0A7R9HLN8_9NEOP|nr:unnamed protein product [Timema monikensis]